MSLHAIALAVETTGLDPYDSRIAGLAECGIIVRQRSYFPSKRSAVVEIAAVGIRIDPATGQGDPGPTLYATRVDPGRGFDARLPVLFHDLTAEDAPRQPRLDRALADLQAAVRDFRPRLLAAHHADFLADALPDATATLTPDEPRWASTRRLAEYLWPHAERHDLDALICDCRLDDRLPRGDAREVVRNAAACAVLLAAQCRAIAAAGHAVTPTLLRDWTVNPPAWPLQPFGGHRRLRG